ncbi:MAG: hypothetical protein CVT48_00920 [Thermoplasmata archaeon HGW-Thermoplasmata-1]|nr:MAG: hypothetical protein CVT48_00920 [Thermoplasmata archaeon HGW-Thermoplasmata-1]
MDEQKTSTGIDENVEGLLCYIAGWFTGLIFLLVEKKSQFVKFHALQSLITFIVLMIIIIPLSFIPAVGWIISMFVGLLMFVLWIVLMIKAYQGEWFKLPLIGDFAEKKAKSS